MIYVIQSETNPAGPVKIGYTKRDGTERLRHLQVGSHEKLRVVALANGDRDTEKYLHRRFKSGRLVGEWFAFSDQIADLIRRHRYTKPLEAKNEWLNLKAKVVPRSRRLARDKVNQF